jgi:hypothetical protein
MFYEKKKIVCYINIELDGARELFVIYYNITKKIYDM